MTGLAARLFSATGAAPLAALILLASLLLLALWRTRSGWRPRLRTIHSFQSLPHLAQTSAESAMPIDIRLATGALDMAGPECSSLQQMVACLSAVPAQAGQSGSLTTGNPVLLALTAPGPLQQGPATDSQPGTGAEYLGPTAVSLATAPSLSPHAAGSMATVIAGSFQGEAFWLLPSARMAEHRTLFIAADAPSAAIAVLAGGDVPTDALPGQDLYAASACLRGSVQAAATLAAQDWARATIVAITLIGVILATIGYGS
ncbi:MAG: hypothetical protein ACOX2L_08775 [Anaerolineae bacterium]|jgi:hypothetical protein|nr:hypothetical protein [Chloroflexota bacterium]